MIDSQQEDKSTPSNWAIVYASAQGQTRVWSDTERLEISKARSAVGRALRRLSAYPNDPVYEAFNRVFVNGDYIPYILLVRANIPNLPNGNPPTITVIDPVTGNLHYNSVLNGQCASSDSTKGVIPLPPAYVSPKMIICNGEMQLTQYTIVHELGHLFDYASGVHYGRAVCGGTDNMPIPCLSGVRVANTISNPIKDCNGDIVMGLLNVWRRGERGWGSGPAKTPAGGRLVTIFQQNSDELYIEAAADMFLNWVYRSNSVNDPESAEFTCNANPNNPNHWIGPGFLNRDWRGQTSYTTLPGNLDNGLSGDRRYARTLTWLRAIFKQHPNW